MSNIDFLKVTVTSSPIARRAEASPLTTSAQVTDFTYHILIFSLQWSLPQKRNSEATNGGAVEAYSHSNEFQRKYSTL